MRDQANIQANFGTNKNKIYEKLTKINNNIQRDDKINKQTNERETKSSKSIDK